MEILLRHPEHGGTMTTPEGVRCYLDREPRRAQLPYLSTKPCEFTPSVVEGLL